MHISFQSVDKFEGWGEFPTFISTLIKDHGINRIAEVGAGANPALNHEFVQANDLEYLAVDENTVELNKATSNNLATFDICQKSVRIPGAPYDLIFGRMTAEHFRNTRLAYDNMFHSLKPGGIVVQSFACLYSVPFLVNRFTPGPLARVLLFWVAPRDCFLHDKFKAFYRECRGPTRRQLQFFEELGFEVLEYRAYFGHHYYENRLKAFDRLERLKSWLLLRIPIPHLASYATVVLRRPK